MGELFPLVPRWLREGARLYGLSGERGCPVETSKNGSASEVLAKVLMGGRADGRPASFLWAGVLRAVSRLFGSGRNCPEASFSSFCAGLASGGVSDLSM